MKEMSTTTPWASKAANCAVLVDALIPWYRARDPSVAFLRSVRQRRIIRPNQVALLFCGIVAALVASKNGLPWAGIRQAVTEGIAAGLPAILILLAVGALIGTWAMSGTIVSMIYYGLKLLKSDLLLRDGPLVCAVVAV